MARPVGSRHMKMLVTRPEPDAQSTLGRLQALGIDAIAAPAMVRQTLDVSLPPPDGFVAMVLTSANAVRALADRGALEIYRHLPVFAVGDRTAREASDAGFARVSSAAGSVQDLVNAMTLANMHGPIFYPSGRHQSADLAHALAPLGIMVVTARLYDMVPIAQLPPDIVGELGQDIAAVLVYSRRSGEVFAQLTESLDTDRRRSLAVLCLSEAVAEPLLAARFSRINLADRPDEEAMMTLALAFAREQTGP